MTLDDEVLMAAFFNDEIPTGQLFINGFESEEERNLVSIIIRGGRFPTKESPRKKEYNQFKRRILKAGASADAPAFDVVFVWKTSPTLIL
ncbi:MAG: hypothetical protein K5864_01585 [Bacteroidales bacterium]|nr:hypothetical protein [Bacteroidales bacterium]